MSKKIFLFSTAAIVAIAGLFSFSFRSHDFAGFADNAGLTLPGGFKANAIAENLGAARHMAVTPQGDIYVHLAGLKSGSGIVELHDAGGMATATEVTRFGDF